MVIRGRSCEVYSIISRQGVFKVVIKRVGILGMNENDYRELECRIARLEGKVDILEKELADLRETQELALSFEER